MKLVKSHIYEYHGELKDCILDAKFLLLSHAAEHNQIGSDKYYLEFLILTCSGYGELFDKWSSNNKGIAKYHIDNFIGFKDISDQYNIKQLHNFKIMTKVING